MSNTSDWHVIYIKSSSSERRPTWMPTHPFFLRYRSVSCYLSMLNGEIAYTNFTIVSMCIWNPLHMHCNLRLLRKILYAHINRTTPSHMEPSQTQDLDNLQIFSERGGMGPWGIKEPGPGRSKSKPSGELLLTRCKCGMQMLILLIMVGGSLESGLRRRIDSNARCLLVICSAAYGAGTGVAFDLFLSRLGHGKVYDDRLIYFPYYLTHPFS